MTRWKVEIVIGADIRHQGVFEAESAWQAALQAARRGWLPDEEFHLAVRPTSEPYTGL